MQASGWVAVVIAGASLGFVPAARAAHFDYLYIEANAGGSSGGHAAIGFGEQVYHFQNRDGLLVLDRQTRRDFFHVYALLNNRTIQLSRVELLEADRELLHEQFKRRHQAQERQLDVLAAVREDRSLLEAWRDEQPVPLPGLGFFDLQRTGSEVAKALRRQIQQRYGADFIVRWRAALEAELAAAAAARPTTWPLLAPADVYHEPPFAAPFARHYLGIASGLAALQVLAQASPLDRQATIAPNGRTWELSTRERERARRASKALRDQLVRLVGSARSDWGEAFLIGLARLEALELSLALGRFVLLDTLPPNAEILSQRQWKSRLDVVAKQVREGHRQLAAARARWSRREPTSERDWTRLEEAANRVHELESALREGRDLRIVRGTLVPIRAGTLDGLPATTLQPRLESVQEREASYSEALEALYRYQLIRRNCVSELFDTIDDSFAGDPAASEIALGGHIDGHARGNFIPFVSAASVQRAYRVVSQHTFASYRELRIAAMKRSESPLLVTLRESNTLTARGYRRGQRDSFFLFFTDDTRVLRPLLGVFNLVAGVGESVWGLLHLPFDRGDTLASGLEGTLVSLPELAFWNIRKGTNDWVPESATRERER
jgi:hypothetical protein